MISKDRGHLVLRLVFNTLIALVLHFTVIPTAGFWQIFVISQVTGFSIGFGVHQGQALGGERWERWRGIFIGLGLILGILISGAINWGFLAWTMHPLEYYRRVFLYILVFGSVFGVPIIYFFISRDQLLQSERRVQEEKIKRLTLEKEAAMTTLRFLQAQIEPHFLFNTLSNVLALMETDSVTARKMLLALNDYLRICLERTRRETVSFSQELDLVRQYLDIFKIRMGDRIQYEIHDRTGLSHLSFPPLILQPLVENAVKHGIAPLVEGGCIHVFCEKEGDRLCIEVRDTGAGLDSTQEAGGCGLDNVSRRLEVIYGGRARFSLGPGENGGTTARVEVPL